MKDLRIRRAKNGFIVEIQPEIGMDGGVFHMGDWFVFETIEALQKFIAEHYGAK